MATNFTIFYEFGVVMIRNDSLDALSPEQVDVLQAAAAATVQRQIDERLREEDAFIQACSEGATLTAAPFSFMAEVGDALDEPILEMLEDPATHEIYDAVDLAAGINKVPDMVECATSQVSDYVPPDPPSTTFPEGVYRVPGSTREQLEVRGVPREDAVNNAVEYTEITFENGSAEFVSYRDGEVYENQGDAPYTIDDRGRLVFSGGWAGNVTVTWWETSDGIAVEVLPIDDPDDRWQQWEVSDDVGLAPRQSGVIRTVDGARRGRRTVTTVPPPTRVPTSTVPLAASTRERSPASPPLPSTCVCCATTAIVRDRQLDHVGTQFVVVQVDGDERWRAVAQGVGDALGRGEVQDQRDRGIDRRVVDVAAHRHDVLIGDRRQGGAQPTVESGGNEASGQPLDLVDDERQRYSRLGGDVGRIAVESLDRPLDPRHDHPLEFRAELGGGEFVGNAQALRRGGDFGGTVPERLHGPVVDGDEAQPVGHPIVERRPCERPGLHWREAVGEQHLTDVVAEIDQHRRLARRRPRSVRRRCPRTRRARPGTRCARRLFRRRGRGRRSTASRRDVRTTPTRRSTRRRQRARRRRAEGASTLRTTEWSVRRLAASVHVAVPSDAVTTSSHGQRPATPAATVTTIAPNPTASVHGVATARSRSSAATYAIRRSANARHATRRTVPRCSTLAAAVTATRA